jgi:hypothetical protein
MSSTGSHRTGRPATLTGVARRTPWRASSRCLLAVVTAGSVLVSVASAAGAAHAKPTSRDAKAESQCAPLRAFLPGHHFPTPTSIDNPYFPLTPGTQLVFEGQANGGGAPIARRVTFTVTDLTKVIAHVRTLAVWDVDEDQGEIVESELAFFAQDDRGNVWNLGEYPEEFEEGEFVGAPSTWFARRDEAVPGVIVPGDPWSPRARSPFLEGFAPAADFLDCAMVSISKAAAAGSRICVPAGCFANVLAIDETSPLDPEGGTQVKYYARGVGNVQVSAVDDPEGETLMLARLAHLPPDQLSAARDAALELERRAYRTSKVYRRTPPLVPLGE